MLQKKGGMPDSQRYPLINPEKYISIFLGRKMIYSNITSMVLEHKF